MNYKSSSLTNQTLWFLHVRMGNQHEDCNFRKVEGVKNKVLCVYLLLNPVKRTSLS